MLLPRSSSIAVLVIVGMLGATARPAHAQLAIPLPRLSLMGGVSRWNLSGHGTAPFGALRIQLPLRSAIAEGSLGVVRPDELDGERTCLIPEAQLQWQWPFWLAQPYVGLGGGWFGAVSGPGPRQSGITGSAAAGLRVRIPRFGAGLRAEVRARAVRAGLSGGATEWTLGVSW